MIEFKKGNLLEDSSAALVNTVNTVGVMGKGVALQFKQAYPSVFQEYKKACDKGEVQVGHMHVVPTNSFVGPKYIINFPTKRHWKEKSKMVYITEGLKDLKDVVETLEIPSIALPPLGCGNGGLNWEDVKPLIEETFADTPVKVHVYEPAGSPKPEKMKIGTTTPNMTEARALLLASLHQYMEPGYRLTLLEIQKIAYFLQEAGEPLKLNFVKNKYGPYAENLNFVLQRLEGHFIRGYGDRNRDSDIYLIHSAGSKAREYLNNKEENLKRLEKVSDIIKGFENPYGMELLATVHWIQKNIQPSTDEELVTEVQNWNDRKKKLFPPKHIMKASNHLQNVLYQHS
ncbi:type II toxin-antitoxin system antitoxin DNA ADP-ribosyl glycohydrolase DarG [Alteribacillus iranensis]|uniref:O-acetyl-ADP-ribose deacetylase (Regulator of RNase III), contains Macro domain n=1 Tax=Alteribacillus iranensis TaxID=930128 RepID=A0A1I2BV10_9BACI|nr:macro domain-containing protein [Alteribacillus iranensis]SFE59949.1 O-acetyl-ADP-ribose deacetylase (regulator of RNase III), contains Macro domain [Alteribacillus iranensis]